MGTERCRNSSKNSTTTGNTTCSNESGQVVGRTSPRRNTERRRNSSKKSTVSQVSQDGTKGGKKRISRQGNTVSHEQRTPNRWQTRKTVEASPLPDRLEIAGATLGGDSHLGCEVTVRDSRGERHDHVNDKCAGKQRAGKT